MKIRFLFLLLFLAVPLNTSAADMKPTVATPVPDPQIQKVRPVTNAYQPAYYENGRPVYIDIKPRKKNCKQDEIYDKPTNKCKKPIKTED